MFTQTLKFNFFAFTFNTQKQQQQKAGHKGLPMKVQQTIAFVALCLLSPLIAIAALLLKLESRGPVFFSQTRVGENGRHFTCYKMRSMYLPSDPKFVDPNTLQSDRDGVCKKFFNDPRITKVGKVIRKLSIDELPQLFNVLKGDMALIGPRPHLTTEYAQYDRHILPRLYCKPGITGLWQISGRADTTFEEQLSLDKSYLKNQSWWLDLKILFGTIPAVITGRGAY